MEGILSLLTRVAEAMGEAVLVIDRQGTVVMANSSAAELLDLEDTAAALRPLAEYDQLIAEWRIGDKPFVPRELLDALSGRAIPRQRATITTRAGSQRIARFTATPVSDERGEIILTLLLLTDVTLEERVNAYWLAVGTGAEGLTAVLDVDHVLRSVVDQIGKALHGDVVLGIWLLDVPEQRLILRICRGVSEQTAERLRSIPLDCPSFLCEAVRTRRMQYIEDAPRTPPGYELDQRLVSDEGLLSWVGSPLPAHAGVLGVMGFGLRGARRFFRHDLEAIETLSRLFAVALQHAELYETSQRQHRFLQEEQRLRAELAQAITHDLRAPLSAIKGRAELLQHRLQAPVAPELRELTMGLAKIRASVDGMARRIAELGDAMQLQSGQSLELHVQQTDLILLAKTAADEHQQTTQRHRLVVQSDTPTLVGRWDAARVGRVLDNLVSNAIKYSPEGGNVTLSLTREQGPDAWAVLRVRDEGLGISPSDLPNIFERFYRGANVAHVGGFGIGLAASRAIVQQHGGTLGVEATDASGSTFVLRLPLPVSHSAAG